MMQQPTTLSASASPATSPSSSPTLGTLARHSSNSSTPTSPPLGINLRSAVTLGHRLIGGDSGIHTLLVALAEKGKSRHEDRKKRKRAKKEKRDKRDRSATWSGSSSSSSSSSTTSSTSTAPAPKSAPSSCTNSPTSTGKKASPVKRKRSVSDVRMYTSADDTVLHRDRSSSAPCNTDVGVAAAPGNKDAIVRSLSSTGLSRDPPAAGGKAKKTNSASGSPAVHHHHHHHHSSSAVPTSPIKKSPRTRGRSSSISGGSSSAGPLRRAAPPAMAASYPGPFTGPSPHSWHAPSSGMAAILSPRSAPAGPEGGVECMHGARPHVGTQHQHQHHHQAQSRTSLATASAQHVCRHTRSAPNLYEYDVVPPSSDDVAVAPTNNGDPEGEGGNASWTLHEAEIELESILQGIEQASASASAMSSPFLSSLASTADSTSTSPVAQSAQSATLSTDQRRPSLDMMSIADTMQRVSIECKEDDFDPMRFLDLELINAAAAAHHQHLTSAGSVQYPPAQPKVHFQQQLTRSMSHPHAYQSAPAPQTTNNPFAMPARCNSEVTGYFSSLLLKEDEQQMRELYMAIDGATPCVPQPYFEPRAFH